jgi:hypothetical protein
MCRGRQGRLLRQNLASTKALRKHVGHSQRLHAAHQPRLATDFLCHEQLHHLVDIVCEANLLFEFVSVTVLDEQGLQKVFDRQGFAPERSIKEIHRAEGTVAAIVVLGSILEDFRKSAGLPGGEDDASA